MSNPLPVPCCYNDHLCACPLMNLDSSFSGMHPWNGLLDHIHFQPPDSDQDSHHWSPGSWAFRLGLERHHQHYQISWASDYRLQTLGPLSLHYHTFNIPSIASCHGKRV